MANTGGVVLLDFAVKDNASASLDKIAKKTKGASGSTDRLINSLRLQNIELKKGKDAMQRAKAALDGASLSEIRRIKTLQNSANELRQKQMAEMNAAHATDMATAAQHRNNQALTEGQRRSRQLRGMAGQLGHQFQDIAVQMQMGTDALLVFGQQGSQIASVLGPSGAIAGAAIAIAAAMSVFFTESEKTKKVASELEKVMGDLANTINLEVATGTRSLTQDFIDLAKSSEDLAKITLQKNYLQAMNATLLANEAFGSSVNRLKKGIQDLDAAGSDQTAVARREAAVKSLKNEFGLTVDEAKDLASALQLAQLGGGEGFAMVQDQLLEMASGTKAGNEAFVNFAHSVVSSMHEMKSAEDQAEFLREVIGKGLPAAIEEFNNTEIDPGFEKVTSDIESLRRSLMTDLEKLNEDYRKNFDAINSNIEISVSERNELLQRLDEKYFSDLKEVQQKSVDARINEEQRYADALSEIQSGILAEIDRQAKEQQRKRDRITSAYEGLELGVSEIDRIKAQEEQKLNILKDYAKLTNMAEAEREAKRRMIIQDSEDQIYQIQAAAAERQLNDQLKLIGGFEGMQRMGVSAISAIVKEGASMSDVFKMVGRTIVDNVIDSIVKMGVEYVKQQMIQKAVENSSAATSVATAAATGLGIATAMAPAAALTSLATGGTNAIGANAGMASTAALSKAIALGSFEGGGFTGAGPRSGGVDGKGGFPAILHPNETVIDHTKNQTMGGVTIVNNIDASGAGPEVDQKIVAAMEVTSQQTVKQVQDLLRRQRLV